MTLVGGVASFWSQRSAQKQQRGFSASLPEVDLAEQRARIERDVRRAGRATARGVNAGATAAWDVAVGGADAVRTRAKVLPTIASSVSEAGSSLGSAAVHAGGAARSFVGATARTLMWLSLLGSALLLIYMPDPNQRDRFFARGRRYFDDARRLVNTTTRRSGRTYGEGPSDDTSFTEQPTV
jgi:hypothetical protein